MTISRDGLIEEAKVVIDQYVVQKLRLTIRQIYYRLVAAQIILNTISSYQKVVKALVYARKTGLVDYDAIEDRTRAVLEPRKVARISKTSYAVAMTEKYEPETSYFNSYMDFVKNLHEHYTLPLWLGQPAKLQIWVEKQALSSLFQAVTDKWGVDLVVCRGYPSLTLLHEASEILNAQDDREIHIPFFGDYDPSGADIERNVGETLVSDFGVPLHIERIAITREQIEKYDIPPAPAKTSDSRYNGFVEREGVAWQVELDAIEPKTLQGLVEDAIKKHYVQGIREERDKELERRRLWIREWTKDAIRLGFKPQKEND